MRTRDITFMLLAFIGFCVFAAWSAHQSQNAVALLVCVEAEAKGYQLNHCKGVLP